MEHISSAVLLIAYTSAITVSVLIAWGMVSLATQVKDYLASRNARITRTYNKVSPYQVLKGIHE